MIVVDTHVLAYFLMPYESGVQAEALYERDPEWVMPIFWRSEFRNLLAGCLCRDMLTCDDIVRINGEAEALLLGNEYEASSRRVLELVRDSDCSACDCEFIALGIEPGVKVITVDRKLPRTFPQYAVPLSGA